jgi:hypothetical protein
MSDRRRPARTGWCPRCDAVHEGGGACPDCGTPLAELYQPAPARPPDDEPAGLAAPAGQPPPSRLRLPALAAIVALAAAAFLVGRAGARPAPLPAATASTAAPTTTAAPTADADRRELGWTARVGRVALTVVSARRERSPDDDTIGLLTVRVAGLPPGQRLFGFRKLRLIDAGGGAFSTPPEDTVAGRQQVVTWPDDQSDTTTVFIGPAPALGALARIEVDGLLVGRAPAGRIELDASGPWPAGGPTRAVQPTGNRRLVVKVDGVPGGIPVRVASALVGGGRAVVVVDADLTAGLPAQLPIVARLERGGGPPCVRTTLLDQSRVFDTGVVVLSCPAQPGRLAVAVSAGVQPLEFRATLER